MSARRSWIAWRPNIETRESALSVTAPTPQQAAEVAFVRMCTDDHDFGDELVCVLGSGEESHWRVQMAIGGAFAARADSDDALRRPAPTEGDTRRRETAGE